MPLPAAAKKVAKKKTVSSPTKKAVALHVIERGGRKVERLTRLGRTREWETGDWTVGNATAASLIGGHIFVHRNQSTLSHIGGVVLSFRTVVGGRKVFRFRQVTALTNVDAGRTGWSYERKIVWESAAKPLPSIPPEDEDAFAEGADAYKQHRTIERNSKLSALAKKLRLQRDGALKCEGCDFDFAAKYGERGAGYIEAHHTTPVSQFKGTRLTKVSELALVCANCHRMLHRSNPVLDVAGLRALIISEGD